MYTTGLTGVNGLEFISDKRTINGCFRPAVAVVASTFGEYSALRACTPCIAASGYTGMLH